MQLIEKKELIKSVVCFVCALMAYFVSMPESLKLDSRASDYFDKSITQAGVAYASVRLINASVTIIKESELQLQPAGLGVSLAVGQILDPLDDMTERVSDVLVLSITALGLQKLVHELCVLMSSTFIAIIFLLLALSFFMNVERVIRVRTLLFKFVVIGVLVRLFLPLSAIANIALEQNFFQPRIDEAHQLIQINTRSIDQLSDFSMPESSGTWEFIDNTGEYIEHKTRNLKIIFKQLVNNSNKIISSLLTITYLYVTLFLVQIILLPLLLFWLLYRVINQLL